MHLPLPKRLAAAVVVLALVGGPTARGHDSHSHGGQPASSPAACAEPTLACAATASPAFAADGTLWLAWAAGEQVWVARSSDLGRSFAPPIAVTKGKLELPLDNGPDARPRVVIDKTGGLLVSFATRDKAYNGHAYLARSRDGLEFEPAREITSNSPSQRFETLALDGDGRIFAAWIDKRNAVKAKAGGGKYAGAALAFAWGEAGGAEMATATIARDNTCECCRLGVAFLAPRRPVVMFRNIFDGGVRDHGVIVFADPATPGPVRRVGVDDWQTDACPHHGPSLAVSPAGALHAVWFTSGKARKGLYYARSSDEGATFSAARRLGRADRQASRPFVLASGGGVWLVWKEFDGERTEVVGQLSRDDGATWSEPRLLARTAETSDHPLLVAHGAKVYLSWLTRQEGYRLIELGDGS